MNVLYGQKLETVFLVAMEDYEVQNLFDMESYVKRKTKPYTYLESRDNSTGILVTGIGIANSSAAAQFACDNFRASCFVNVGVAGLLDPSIGIGEVQCISKVAFHDVDVRAFDYQLGQIPGCDVDSYKLRCAIPDYPSVSCISGSSFVTEKADIKESAELHDAKVVDMELAGIAHVMYQNGCLEKLCAFKAGTDYVDKKSTKSFYDSEKRAFSELRSVVRSFEEDRL